MTKNIVAALDLGTTKVCVVIAEKTGNDQYTVLGYGTAKSEGMTKGMSVTADSLVWRDGWTDWRLAGEVLPQLATRTPPAFAAAPGMAAPAAAANASPEAANAPAARYIRSRRSKSSTIAAICVLGVVAFALVGVLIFILTRQP